MCRIAHLRLSPDEKKAVRKLSEVMIPIYASIALVLLAVVTITQVPHSGDAVAVAKSNPAN
jgi:hypothetical protein